MGGASNMQHVHKAEAAASPLQRLTSVAEAIPALVAYITPDQRYALANRAYHEWLSAEPGSIVNRTVADVLGPELYPSIAGHLDQALAGSRVTFDTHADRHDGTRFVEATYIPDRQSDGTVAGVIAWITDITPRKRLELELREQAASSAALARLGQMLAGELDLSRLVQAITDAGTQLSRAQFGAFFYNVLGEAGESYTLYTLSGAPREAFAGFGMPRNTPIFEPTFRGTGVVRFDDVTAQPVFGRNPPHNGLPAGHLPVRSYLAVPVVSGTGEVLGGLFFGHEQPAIFTAASEAQIVALAAHAAVAIDNSRLVAALRRERAQAEETGRQHQTLAEAIPHLVWTTDGVGAVDHVNRRWIEYTGLDLEHASGSGWQQAFHPDDLEPVGSAWARAVASGDRYEITARVRRCSDGAYRWHLNRAYPLTDASGRVVRWFGTCTDIHDQKQHEDSERLLSEVSRVLAASLDLDATLSTVAAMVAAWFGGYCLIDLLHDGSLRRTAAVHVDPAKQPLLDELRAFAPGDDHTGPIWRAIDARKTELCNRITEEVIRQGSRSARHAAIRRQLATTGYMIAPMLAGGQTVGAIMLGSTSGYVFQTEDIAPVEELAYRIAISVTNARAFAQARDANRLKDEFLAIVSHELRTPLNAMRGWTSLLKTGKLTGEQQRQALEVIDRNITAQAQLVEDLLDISRIVSGGMRLTIEAIDLAAVVGSAIESVTPAAEAKQISLVPSLDVSIGFVNGDAGRLQQVVWNLLSNAIKFTGRGGRVDVSLRRSAGHVELEVADTGQGIPPEFLPHVFDRFRQADSTTTRPFGGLGLGLAIVRHLVELHGGTVLAFSDGVGRGARFVVRLAQNP